jgi:hypothetical protein
MHRAPTLPRFRDEIHLTGLELREAASVARHVHDDFLAREGRIQVGDDTNQPAGRVRLTVIGADRERLGRRAVLAAFTERARVELLVARGLELRPLGAGSFGTARSDDDAATRGRIAA